MANKNSLGTLVYSIGVENSGLEKGLKKSSRSVDRFGRQMKQQAAAMNSFKRQAATMASSAVAGVGGASAMAGIAGLKSLLAGIAAGQAAEVAAQRKGNKNTSVALENQYWDRNVQQRQLYNLEQLVRMSRGNRRNRMSWGQWEHDELANDRSARPEESGGGSGGNGGMRRAGQQMGRMFRTIRPLLNPVTVGLAALTAGAVAFSAALKEANKRGNEAAEAFDALNKKSQLLGVSANQLLVLREQARQFAGIEGAALDTALQRLTRRAADGTLDKTLTKLGVSLQEFKSANPAKQVDMLADATKNLSEAERLAVSFKAFDTEGAQMALLLNKSVAEREVIFSRINELGGIRTKREEEILALVTSQREELELQEDSFKTRAGAEAAAVTANLQKANLAIKEYTHWQSLRAKVVISWYEGLNIGAGILADIAENDWNFENSGEALVNFFTEIDDRAASLDYYLGKAAQEALDAEKAVLAQKQAHIQLVASLETEVDEAQKKLDILIMGEQAARRQAELAKAVDAQQAAEIDAELRKLELIEAQVKAEEERKKLREESLGRQNSMREQIADNNKSRFASQSAAQAYAMSGNAEQAMIVGRYAAEFELLNQRLSAGKITVSEWNKETQLTNKLRQQEIDGLREKQRLEQQLEGLRRAERLVLEWKTKELDRINKKEADALRAIDGASAGGSAFQAGSKEESAFLRDMELQSRRDAMTKKANDEAKQQRDDANNIATQTLNAIKQTQGIADARIQFGEM